MSRLLWPPVLVMHLGMACNPSDVLLCSAHEALGFVLRQHLHHALNSGPPVAMDFREPTSMTEPLQITLWTSINVTPSPRVE